MANYCGSERLVPRPSFKPNEVCQDNRTDHRRLPPARHHGGLRHSRPHGTGTGSCHAHVLIDKQGNFGSIAGLPPAAERYTEARLSGFAAEMLADLDKETVEMVPNYDGRVKEPMVLPSRFPNLLVNGSGGIAVGMATSIPPHNLGEVCKAVIRLIDNPNVTINELMQDIPGPDFPTGGVICGRQGIYDGYHTGRGKVHHSGTSQD